MGQVGGDSVGSTIAENPTASRRQPDGADLVEYQVFGTGVGDSARARSSKGLLAFDEPLDGATQLEVLNDQTIRSSATRIPSFPSELRRCSMTAWAKNSVFSARGAAGTKNHVSDMFPVGMSSMLK